MYKVSAIYTAPDGEEPWFNHDLYNKVHVPMMARDFAGKVPFSSIDLQINIEELCFTRVVKGKSAESEKPQHAVAVSPLIASLYFESRQDAYNFAEFVLSPDAAALHADITTYTNCHIQWVVGEVVSPV